MPNTVQFEQLAGFLNNWPWLATQLYENSVGDYFAVAGTVLLVWIVSHAFTWLLRKHAQKLTSRTESKLDDTIVELIHRSITFILVLTTLYLGIKSLNLPISLDEFAAKAFFILFTLKIARELDRFSKFFIRSYLEPYARKQKGLTQTFVGPLSRISKFVIWVLSILLIVANLGYDISSLLAGLGVGGLAFALAAQETLSNALGSISILTDQPFKLGDYVEIQGTQGTVVGIGLRSTQIRTISQNIVSIPNKVTASVKVINYSRRKQFNVDLKIGLGFSTSASEIKLLIKSLERVLRKDPAVPNDTFRINVTDFGDYAIELTVFYYIDDVSTYARSIAIRERVNLKIKETVEKMGIDIPFPTQSLRIENARNFMPAPSHKKAN
ncbi:MAG: MscS family membrane protein [Oceanicoccus sp.]|jgi:MscS family membrane protein